MTELVSDIHIDDFFHDAAKSLILLYQHFPRKTMLYVEDISGPDTQDEFGLHSKRHEACFHTFLWLATCGYLQFETTVRQEAIDQAVLTHRGFLVLSTPYPHATPDLNDGLPREVAIEETLSVHRIRHALKHGSSFTLAETMRTVMNMSRQFCDQIAPPDKR